MAKRFNASPFHNFWDDKDIHPRNLHNTVLKHDITAFEVDCGTGITKLMMSRLDRNGSVYCLSNLDSSDFVL